MAKQPTKTEPNSTSSDGESSASETATGAVPATGGKPEEAGAGTDSPAPVTGAPGGLSADAVATDLMAQWKAEIVAWLLAEAPRGEEPVFLSVLLDHVVLGLCARLVAGSGADDLLDALVARLAAREMVVTEVAITDLIATRRAATAPEPVGADWHNEIQQEVLAVVGGDISAAVLAADEAPPADLCKRLGVAAKDVFAFNVVTGTIVTRDGQKHRVG